MRKNTTFVFLVQISLPWFSQVLSIVAQMTLFHFSPWLNDTPILHIYMPYPLNLFLFFNDDAFLYWYLSFRFRPGYASKCPHFSLTLFWYNFLGGCCCSLFSLCVTAVDILEVAFLNEVLSLNTQRSTWLYCLSAWSKGMLQPSTFFLQS